MNALKPPPSLLLKLASAVVHADEYLNDGGHGFDLNAFQQQIDDPEVKGWIDEMTRAGMAPLKRKPV